MSTSTPANPSTPLKPKAKRSKDKDRDRKEKTQLPSERLKIVVRRLPPTLPEGIFWQSVSTWITEESVSWKAYYPGKPKKRANKENIPSRAYVVFKTPDQLLVFGREFDGHKFVDKAGNESHAVVEYAPYQKVPGEKKKPDSRHATIEKDEDYISFIESLNVPSAAEPVSIETLIASTRPPSPPKTTPLLEALKAEKRAQKDKEAIIRNHPHYKDLLNNPSASSLRKEERRKATRADVAAKKGKKAAAAAAAPSPKPVQIQAKPSTNVPAQNVSVAAASTTKTQPPPARPSRKHVPKASKEAVQAPSNVNPTPAPTPNNDTPLANTPRALSPAQRLGHDSAPLVTTPARRGRPVLGLGSRHFEAALSGVGVSGERKRREKEKEVVVSPPREPQEKTNLPTSPKRHRPRKEELASSSNVPDVAVMPRVDGGGLPSHMRGGKRGGGRGRGRGGPPRIG